VTLFPLRRTYLCCKVENKCDRYYTVSDKRIRPIVSVAVICLRYILRLINAFLMTDYFAELWRCAIQLTRYGATQVPRRLRDEMMIMMMVVIN